MIGDSISGVKNKANKIDNYSKYKPNAQGELLLIII